MIGQLLPPRGGGRAQFRSDLAVLVILLEGTRSRSDAVRDRLRLGPAVMTTLFAVGSRAIPARRAPRPSASSEPPRSSSASPWRRMSGTSVSGETDASARAATPVDARAWPAAPPPGPGSRPGSQRPAEVDPAGGGGRPGDRLTQLTPSSYAIGARRLHRHRRELGRRSRSLALIRPTKAQRPLASAEDWLLRNRGTVATIVGVVVGLVIVGNGLMRF